MKMSTRTVENPKVVSREEWLVARKKLLAKEKQLTRQRDAIAAERRQLPWVKVEKNYVFDSPSGKKTLADLFDGRSQLIVYHFMFGPEWQEGCPSCSFNMDHTDGALVQFPSAEAPGVSVFYKDKDGNIFHSYSAYARGSENTINTYNYLDLVPKGRDEDNLPFTMAWLRHHDRYETGYLADPDRPYWPKAAV